MTNFVKPSHIIWQIKRYMAWLLVFLVTACDSHLAAEPPLHRAAYKGDIPMLKQLIAEGHSVHALNSEGATPLHWAAFKGHQGAAETLLRYGAEVNARTKKGSTALRLAQTHKHDELARLLERYGASAE